MREPEPKPAPKHRFCWWCSRQLWGNSYRVVHAQGADRVVHGACAADATNSESAPPHYPRPALVPAIRSLDEAPQHLARPADSRTEAEPTALAEHRRRGGTVML